MSSTGASLARGRSKQDYATPPDFMLAVSRRFDPINFDLAAHEQNTKHANFFSIRDNSLVQEWHKIPGILWLNPPFDNIGPWAKKCAQEADMGAQILFLTPASVGSNWFADYVFPNAAVYGLVGRIAFDPLHPKWGYPKDCILSEFGRCRGKQFDTWKWKADAEPPTLEVV